MSRHVSTQMYAAKQARNEPGNEETSECATVSGLRFGFVARQLCGHLGKKIEADRDLIQAILARSPRD